VWNQCLLYSPFQIDPTIINLLWKFYNTPNNTCIRLSVKKSILRNLYTLYISKDTDDITAALSFA
jgi:hypothetical protein